MDSQINQNKSVDACLKVFFGYIFMSNHICSEFKWFRDVIYHFLIRHICCKGCMSALHLLQQPLTNCTNNALLNVLKYCSITVIDTSPIDLTSDKG